jgi:hypothetical protein
LAARCEFLSPEDRNGAGTHPGAVVDIALVAQQHPVDSPVRVTLHFAHPRPDAVEGAAVCHVVHQEDALRKNGVLKEINTVERSNESPTQLQVVTSLWPPEEQCPECMETILPRRVPDLRTSGPASRTLELY